MRAKSITFTKDYAVGFKRTDCSIPPVLLNFGGDQTGHSKCIMGLIGELFECNTFAECVSFGEKMEDTICGMLEIRWKW